jgi:uncharacterized membrane protein (DUF106 family)
MADPPAQPPRQKMSLWTIISMVAVVYILFLNPNARILLGKYTGYLLDPIIGFGGHYPVLTIMLSGALIVVGTTLVRHFTTDWLEMAKMQAYMRHYNQERMKATKENNTYKIKALQEKQPDIMARQQRMQSAQFKQMPLTLLVSIPIFSWVTTFIANLDYSAFAEPWNPVVSMNGTTGILPGVGSLFPHWVLLSMALTVPFGFLVQRIMKYVAWRERWQKRHPEVHEG